MTQQNINGQEADQSERRGRGPTKPFPTISFDEALQLANGINEFAVDNEMQRLTLMAKLNLSPTSSKTRQLISGSTKYGLTIGSYGAPTMKVTDDGLFILDDTRSRRALKEKQFELAITNFDPFREVFERLKEQRLPDEAVLKDEFGRVGIPEKDQQGALEVFASNLRYIGLIENISGSDHVRSIESIVEQLPSEDSREIQVDEELTTTLLPSDMSPRQSTVVKGITANEPSIHIDIQIHIDSSATAQQIDQIFASMSRHLYGREG